MSFPRSVSARTPDGNVNYCAASHNTFVERWLQELADLKSSGWDSSSTDLRLTYIDALSTNKTLHKEAQNHKCGGSYTLLISHMREWTQNHTARQKAEAAQRKLLEDNSGSVYVEQHFAKDNPPPTKSGAAAKPFTDTKALMTKMDEMKSELGKLKKLHPLEAMSQAKGPNMWQAKNPSHVDGKPFDGNKDFFCNGCGHKYGKDGRRIACLPDCVYSEHPHHNTNYKNASSGAATPYPAGQAKLEWGTPESYLKKFNKEMPERAKRYVASRAAFAVKRARPGDNKSDTET
jgi:hypothetical protein